MNILSKFSQETLCFSNLFLKLYYYSADINDREDCAKKFMSNRWVGLCLFLGISLGTLVKEKDQELIRVQEIVEEAARVPARVVNT